MSPIIRAGPAPHSTCLLRLPSASLTIEDNRPYQMNHDAEDEVEKTLSDRKWMRHETPPWVGSDAVFFLTICAGNRGGAEFLDNNRAKRILESAKFYHDNKKWWVSLILVMPDHLHMLVQFPPQTEMNMLVKNWKRFLTRETAVSWQKGFFEHRIRNDESLQEKADYIRNNPLTAGLIEPDEEWPWQDGFMNRYGRLSPIVSAGPAAHPTRRLQLPLGFADD